MIKTLLINCPMITNQQAVKIQIRMKITHVNKLTMMPLNYWNDRKN